MIDQYYKETLPQLLQELDDVYHDVSAVVADTLIQGADVMALKCGENGRRYENLGRIIKLIRPPEDLNAFVKTLHIPETLAVSKHVFAPPQPNDPAQLETAPPLRDQIIIDRATQNSVQNRFDNLKKEASDIEVRNQQLKDALDNVIRIQARSLESQLFNKANELQEDISLKRFDQRVAQLHLGAIKAQKEMFAKNNEGGIGNGGNFASGPNHTGAGQPASNRLTANLEPPAVSDRERKMSSGSGSAGGGNAAAPVGMKNKWMKAFKGVKKDTSEERVHKNGGESSPQMNEAHVFQEYTYKKITPCDICSQILRGHTRQGLKCKLCRMNVHPDCQIDAGKCTPKSRLLRRQKSSSEIETRNVGQGGQDFEDDSGFCHEDSFDLDPDARRHYLTVKSLSTESA